MTLSKEDYIAATAKEIFQMIPLTIMVVDIYDIIQTRCMLLLLLLLRLLLHNKSDVITPSCHVVLLQEAGAME